MKTKLVLAVALLTGGCSSVERKHQIYSGRLSDESAALTSAVVDSLQAAPPDTRDVYSELALRLARQDQRIEGFPARPIDTTALLGIDTNMAPREIRAAREGLATRFAEQDRLVARAKGASDRLMAMGAEAEDARNRRIRWWSKWLGSGGLVLGAVVAVCVFFPVAIPILGRVLAWLAGKVPSMAGAVGVVSVKAFDAVVRGIERTQSGQGESRMSNAENGRAEAEGNLHVNLSRSMDAEHKALVKRRKLALGLN